VFASHKKQVHQLKVLVNPLISGGGLKEIVFLNRFFYFPLAHHGDKNYEENQHSGDHLLVFVGEPIVCKDRG